MSGYAAFAAAHRERLVRALVAETGLSRARAQALAREVLAAAWERGVTFPDGAAYGWLRVAARHLAADPASAWADAADAAVAQAHDAVAALAGLAASEREIIRLRYAEGLPPGVIADRLGTTVADVSSKLDRAARRLSRRRLVPYLRPVAAAVLAGVAAASLVVSTARSGSPLPPWAADLPWRLGTPSWLEPVDATTHVGPGAGVLATQPAAYVAVIDRSEEFGGGPAKNPRHGCTLTVGCRKTPTEDKIIVWVPHQVSEATGTDDKITVGAPVSLCTTVPTPSNDIASCVPGHA